MSNTPDLVSRIVADDGLNELMPPSCITTDAGRS
jgi:hypothetical protein